MAEVARALQPWLIEAGLLPDGLTTAVGLGPSGSGTSDMLPGLVRVWQSAHEEVVGGGSRRRARHMLGWLESQVDNGAALTLGVPVWGHQRTDSWIAPRLAWWPRGIPDARRVGLVSSRLGQAPEERQGWFTVLRAACAKLHPSHEILLTASSTATAPYVKRCADLFGLRRLDVVAPEGPAVPGRRWLQRIRHLPPEAVEPSSTYRVYLSPILTGGHARRHGDSRSTARQLPLRDRALVAMSDRLVVLYVRRNGNLHRLLRRRLREHWQPLARVQIALGQGLTDAALARQLLARGAVGWMVLDTPGEGNSAAVGVSPAPTESKPCLPGGASDTVITLSDTGTWEYLTHCTRRQPGPWPDQDEDEYLDDLIFQRGGADHSPFSAIKRIVEQRRLVASARAIRGAVAVVSFTSIPLAELHRLRVFRPHRTRWDFQPYGICIRRDWLRRRATRPVRYATDHEWARMSANERPFFQLGHTRSRYGKGAINWTVEQEWRHVGDVRLESLPADAGFVFVPSEAEARLLAPISRWPVVVLPTGG